MKKLCFVAYDAAPSLCFERLGASLLTARPDLQITSFLCDGRPVTHSTDALLQGIERADLLLLGMSSDTRAAELEMMAGLQAQRLGVPIGFYSDMPLAVYRAREGAWFNELARDARLLIGMMPKTSDVVKFLFPNARCVNTGNPFREEMFYPSITRNDARRKLGISESQKLILTPGGKYAAANMALWAILIEALRVKRYRREVVLVLAPHPGDATVRAIDSMSGRPLNLYEEFVTHTSVRTLILKKDVLTTSEALQGADLVVEYTGSTSVEAACRRIPVISVDFEISSRRHAKETGLSHVEVVESGAGVEAEPNPYELGTTLVHLLENTHGHTDLLRAAQVAAYPLLERGHALREMTNAVLSFIG